MSDSLPFTPVPVRARRDGWTPETQVRFVAELARTRNVTAACRAVSRSWQSAYRLRARADADGFAAAWDAALTPPALPDAFTGRAMGGLVEPITYRGRRIGERRRVDNRLATYILRVRSPERYGVARGDCRTGAPDLAEALVKLRRELAAGVAPYEGTDSSDDVARTSSPSAQRARSQPRCVRDAPARPAAPAPSDVTRFTRVTRPPPDPPPGGQTRPAPR